MTKSEAIICGHPTHVHSRVIHPESGDKKSDSSFSEDVFVTLDSSCKVFMLRLWDLDTSIQMKQTRHLEIIEHFTVDCRFQGQDVHEPPFQCDVLVLLCLIGGLCFIHHKGTDTGGQGDEQHDAVGHLLPVRGDKGEGS